MMGVRSVPGAWSLKVQLCPEFLWIAAAGNRYNKGPGEAGSDQRGQPGAPESTQAGSHEALLPGSQLFECHMRLWLL
jgi:hypothetical protein